METVYPNKGIHRFLFVMIFKLEFWSARTALNNDIENNLPQNHSEKNGNADNR